MKSKYDPERAPAVELRARLLVDRAQHATLQGLVATPSSLLRAIRKLCTRANARYALTGPQRLCRTLRKQAPPLRLGPNSNAAQGGSTAAAVHDAATGDHGQRAVVAAVQNVAAVDQAATVATAVATAVAT